MRRQLLSLLAATTIAAGIPAVASAQTWLRMDQREYQLDQRIDAGVRSGQLTASEASQLRAEFRNLMILEDQYMRNGLTLSERADLDRRFDLLENRVMYDRRDSERAYGYGNGYNNQYGYNDRWDNLNQRQAQFNQRLTMAVRDRRISQRQADYLRTEFRTIARLERQYRRNGLTVNERADLDRRFDRLETTFRAQVNATQYGYGYGQAPNLFDFIFGIR